MLTLSFWQANIPCPCKAPRGLQQINDFLRYYKQQVIAASPPNLAPAWTLHQSTSLAPWWVMTEVTHRQLPRPLLVLCFGDDCAYDDEKYSALMRAEYASQRSSQSRQHLARMEEERAKVVKLIILGGVATGKQTFADALRAQTPSDGTTRQCGRSTLTCFTMKSVRFEVRVLRGVGDWGAQFAHNMTDCNAVLYMVDISNEISSQLDMFGLWVNRKAFHPMPLILLLNKKDLRTPNAVSTRSQVKPNQDPTPLSHLFD